MTNLDAFPTAPPLAPSSAAPGAPDLPERPPLVGESPPGSPRPPAGGPPQAPTPTPGRPSRGLLLAAAAMIAVGVVLAALLVRNGTTDETADATTPSTTTTAPSEPSSSTSSTSSTTPDQATTTTTGPPVDPVELDATITQLMAFVEDAYGLEFEQRPKVELLPVAEFDQRLQGQATDEQLKAEAERLSQAGLLPPGADPIQEYRKALTDHVAGFYDPVAKALAVKNTALDADAKQVLVHELTHALQDQHFDLDRPEYADLQDETEFGFRAVVEGDARRIERLYRDQENPTNPSPPAELEDLSGQDPNDYSAIVTDMLAAPYIYGERLVTELLDFRGDRQLVAAFEDPPTTSEQVVHWDRYVTGEERIEVLAPPAEGQITDEGVFGELMTEAMLEAKLGRETAAQAATGWGGDWYVQYTSEEGLSCLRIDWQMDSRGDFGELQDAFDAWLQAGGLGEITQPDQQTLRFTNCVPPAGSSGGESPF